MLILTRRLGESIKILEDNITVTVLSTQGGNIRIGIDAPKNISVHREEVYEKILANRKTPDKEEAITA